MWTCPECGTQNPVDATECASCGRWASVFDLERTQDDEDQPHEPTRAGAPEAVIVESSRPSATDRGKAILDTLRELGDATEAEPKSDERRSGRRLRWIFVALAVFWFVVIPLIDQLR